MKLLTKFFAEFSASAIVVFLGCMGDVDQSPFFTPTYMSSSLVWGFAVMMGLNSFAHISGGFMSPLITLAAFIHNILDITVSKKM